MRSLTGCRELCRAYFSSGCYFLFPYCAAYVIYGRYGLGVHQPSHWSEPALLSVFYWIHVAHGVIGLFALWGPRRIDKSFTAPPLGPGWLSWLGLSLVFLLPGLYLEWPSDTWEHLRRINEWDQVNSVHAHSAWPKASYFLLYSLSGGPTAFLHEARLLLLYLAFCLLLCWQYYRLARTLGWSPALSFVASLVACIFLGNSAFAFTRYYGLSSSIVGQIATIALIRVAFETLLRWRIRHLVIGGALAFVAYCNHTQAILAASLGIASIAAWKITTLRHGKMLLIIVAVLANLAAWLIPRKAQWSSLVLAPGWTGFGDGLAVYSPASPAFERAWLILALAGALNCLAAAWLLRRNHPLAWLTLGPVMLLACPAVAVPLLNALVEADQPVLVFHRLLFAVPPMFALVAVGASAWTLIANRAPHLGQVVIVVVPVMVLVLPPSPPWFGRLYNLLSYEAPGAAELPVGMRAELDASAATAKLWASPPIDFRLRTAGYRTAREAPREIWSSPALQIEQLRDAMENEESAAVLVTSDEFAISQSTSIMSLASGHWPKEATAAAMAGQPELRLGVQDWSELQRFGSMAIHRMGPSYVFVSLSGEATLRPARSNSIYFAPPNAAATVELSGQVVAGALKGKYAFPPPDDGRLKLRLRPDQAPSTNPLLLTTSADFALRHARIVVRGPLIPKLDRAPLSATREVELVRDIRLSGSGPDDGATIRIPLDSSKRHVVTIRGSSDASPPRLRIHGVSDTAAQSAPRELLLTGAGAHFAVNNIRELELDIMLAHGCDYFIQKISLRTETVDEANMIPSIFSNAANFALPE